MKNENDIDIPDAHFVLSYNSAGFDEVLSTLDKAKWIIIVTYSISIRSMNLLTRLYDAGKHSKIILITNIPGRCQFYNCNYKRNNAKSLINTYLNRLNPLNFESEAQVYFNYGNHSKIIMTDTVAYIGSENFSDASISNIEAGIITHDKNCIEKIVEQIKSTILNYSAPYYTESYTKILIEATEALNDIRSVLEQFHYETYTYFDDSYCSQKEYYITDQIFLSDETLEYVSEKSGEVENVAIEMCSELENLSNTDEYYVDILDNICDITELISEETSSEVLTEMAEFDSSEFENDLLSGEYYSEAYDEQLEHYVELASDKATEKINEITNNAKNEVDALYENMNRLEHEFQRMISIYRDSGLKQVNPNIDNTRL